VAMRLHLTLTTLRRFRPGRGNNQPVITGTPLDGVRAISICVDGFRYRAIGNRLGRASQR
jgi:hypothetical protein